MSEVPNLTAIVGLDGGEERRGSVTSAKSVASAYSTESERVNNESTKENNHHDEDEVCCARVSLPPPLCSTFPLFPNLGLFHHRTIGFTEWAVPSVLIVLAPLFLLH